MKITSFIFNNKQEGWEFEKIEFSELTLLVGISGVGKTQILKAILALKKIINGNAEPGLYWQINFDTDENVSYVWEGELSQIDKLKEEDLLVRDEDTREKPTFVFEKLWLNGSLIIDRDTEKIVYKTIELPKLDINESVIKILKEEDIKTVFLGFNKIIFRDHTEKNGTFRVFDFRRDFEILKNKYNSIEKIRESELDIIRKLALLQEVDSNLYQDIKLKFCDIFPQVENVRIEKPETPLSFYRIQLKVTNSEKWVNENSISSGMLRTLIHIAEMFLCEDGTVFLIDEFENSLGVNCVNILSEDLLLENQRMQFIVTSHHPYIINNIPSEYWKIVTRSGAKIKVFDASDFNLSESPHENFFKLINLKEYKHGIEL